MEKWRHINYQGFSITLTNLNGKTKIVIVQGKDEFEANLEMDLSEAEQWAKDKIDAGTVF